MTQRKAIIIWAIIESVIVMALILLAVTGVLSALAYCFSFLVLLPLSVGSLLLIKRKLE